MVLEQFCQELAKVFLRCGELSVQMHPVQDINHSLLTYHFRKEATSTLAASAFICLAG